MSHERVDCLSRRTSSAARTPFLSSSSAIAVCRSLLIRLHSTLRVGILLSHRSPQIPGFSPFVDLSKAGGGHSRGWSPPKCQSSKALCLDTCRWLVTGTMAKPSAVALSGNRLRLGAYTGRFRYCRGRRGNARMLSEAGPAARLRWVFEIRERVSTGTVSVDAIPHGENGRQEGFNFRREPCMIEA